VFRVQGEGFRALVGGLGARVRCVGSMGYGAVSGAGVWVVGTVLLLGFGIWGSGVGVWGLGLGCGLHDFGRNKRTRVPSASTSTFFTRYSLKPSP